MVGRVGVEPTLFQYVGDLQSLALATRHTGPQEGRLRAYSHSYLPKTGVFIAPPPHSRPVNFVLPYAIIFSYEVYETYLMVLPFERH